jgi:hypothetical protein
LKDEAIDRIVYRTRFGRIYIPVVRQTAEWNEWNTRIVSHCLWFPEKSTDRGFL